MAKGEPISSGRMVGSSVESSDATSRATGLPALTGSPSIALMFTPPSKFVIVSLWASESLVRTPITRGSTVPDCRAATPLGSSTRLVLFSSAAVSGEASTSDSGSAVVDSTACGSPELSGGFSSESSADAASAVFAACLASGESAAAILAAASWALSGLGSAATSGAAAAALALVAGASSGSTLGSAAGAAAAAAGGGADAAAPPAPVSAGRPFGSNAGAGVDPDTAGAPPPPPSFGSAGRSTRESTLRTSPGNASRCGSTSSVKRPMTMPSIAAAIITPASEDLDSRMSSVCIALPAPNAISSARRSRPASRHAPAGSRRKRARKPGIDEQPLDDPRGEVRLGQVRRHLSRP